MLSAWPSKFRLFSLLTPFWMPLLALAQFNSGVQGTVTDPTGAVVAQAAITLQNTTTGVENSTQTDSSGSYRFSGIVYGDYKLLVQSAGFQQVQVPFAVGTQETAGVDVKLQLSSSSTSIAVTEQAAGINPDETRLVSTITGTQLADLPLPQRGTLGIIKLAPGAVSTSPSEVISNIAIGSQQPAVSANGRPASSNLYRLDGIPIMSAQSYGNLNLVPTPDMIGETALQTTNFSAETGGTSSIVTDFTTKSGSNLFHGDIDGTYSSRLFAQHQWNTGASSPYTQKWLSGALGGAVIKNRTFFFGSAETQVLQNSAGGQVGPLETDQFYSWAAGALPDSRIVNQFMKYRPSRVQFTGVSKYASDIYPADGSAGLACGTPSTDNMPCSLPVLGTGYFSQSPRLPGTQYNVRLDHYFRGDKDRLFLNYFRVDQVSDFLSDRPAMDSTTPSTTEFAAANYVHTLSANLLNQAQFGWTRFHSAFGGTGNNVWIDTPFIMMDLGFGGTDRLGFFGYFPVDIDPGGVNTKDHEYRFRDYLNWVKSNHSLRLGFDSTHEDYWIDNSAEYARPFIVQYTSFWNMLNDNPFSYQLYTISAQNGKFTPQTFGSQVTQFGLYLQDDWKLRPNLSINWGLRWDDYGNPYQYGDRSQPFVNVFYNGVAKTQSDLQKALVDTSYTKFVKNAFSGRLNGNAEPRLGIAWSPGADRKTLVRAGFGYYIDALDLAAVTNNLPTQPPNRLTLTLNAFNPDLPAPGKTPFGTSPLYPYGFNYPAITTGGFDSRGEVLDSAGHIISSDLNGLDPNLKPQRTGIWNVALQRELPSRLVLEAAYSGSYSWDQFYTPNWNLSPGNPNGLTSEWGKIKYVRNGFTSNYNAMILSFHQSLGGLNWTASYTWSHAMTDQFIGSSSDIAAIGYGNAPFDVRQHFSFGGTYRLPSPRGLLLKETLGGWTIGSILIAQTGTPFTVVNSTDTLNDGDNCAPCSVPNILPGTHTEGFSRAQYIAGILPTATVNGAKVATGLSLAPSGANGNEAPNTFRNPGYLGLDLSLVKRIVLPWFLDQTSAFTFRVEALNALNRTNLTGFGSTVYNGPGNAVPSFYGQVTSAAPPRIFQLGARFEF